MTGKVIDISEIGLTCSRLIIDQEETVPLDQIHSHQKDLGGIEQAEKYHRILGMNFFVNEKFSVSYGGRYQFSIPTLRAFDRESYVGWVCTL